MRTLSQLPNITLNPTLDGIQDAVNSTAKAILQVNPQPAICCCWCVLAARPQQLFMQPQSIHIPAACCRCLDCVSCLATPRPVAACTAYKCFSQAHLCCLQASRQLRCWGMISGPPTYYDLIARDKEVVKSVLLLTGSVEGVKQQVAEYLSHFDKYAFLWKQSLQVR
jgi:hypothetical protein